MNGESTTTGPLFFGRWSQPAALTNAGFIPPDLYLLEKILFCATCGQQFFGAHLTGTPIADSAPVTGGAHEPGSAPVTGVVHQAGGAHRPGSRRVTDMHLTSTRVTGTHLISTRDADQPEGSRVYRTACGCRPGPLPAGEVELRVYAETHVLAFGTDIGQRFDEHALRGVGGAVVQPGRGRLDRR